MNDSPEQLKRALPGSSSLELAIYIAGDAHAEINQSISVALGALPGTTKVDTTAAEPGEYTHKVFGENVHSMIGKASQAVSELGAEVRQVSVKKASLEEVFLSLTGRHLR